MSTSAPLRDAPLGAAMPPSAPLRSAAMVMAALDGHEGSLPPKKRSRSASSLNGHGSTPSPPPGAPLAPSGGPAAYAAGGAHPAVAAAGASGRPYAPPSAAPALGGAPSDPGVSAFSAAAVHSGSVPAPVAQREASTTKPCQAKASDGGYHIVAAALQQRMPFYAR